MKKTFCFKLIFKIFSFIKYLCGGVVSIPLKLYVSQSLCRDKKEGKKKKMMLNKTNYVLVIISLEVIIQFRFSLFIGFLFSHNFFTVKRNKLQLNFLFKIF